MVFGLRVARSDDESGPDRLLDTVRRKHALPLLLMVNSGHSALLSRSLLDDGIKVVVKPIRREILYRNICALFGLDRRTPDAEAPCEVHAREFAGLRVLVAEDNDFNRDLVTRVLQAAGAEVTQATSGDAALELVRANDFDIVIMDLHLPGMDGAETARRLRALGPDKRLMPIIALTADVFANDRDGDAMEMDAYLVKPLDEGKLWHAIRRLCRPAAATSASAEDAAASVSVAEIRRRMQPRLVASIAQQRQRIGEAVTRRDLAALGELAHELRGVTGYFGLKEFSEAVAEFERVLARSDGFEEIERQLARIDAFIEGLSSTAEDDAAETSA